ncbi:uncharacterized protein BP01DRAFT_380945 [Aspergillus saccharolyticus JOP 1030-1]|uniref:Uncharacterized protein n=1 Tax=Aspergillus saccharolyticus JOP 1030-1 TaxID=1450539 RepID=A0A319AKG1_9EURO|nr:hypothetical protein BP01DRAFT_380945 [Aspergillus saccharolyticus JOP 1030-1]PYH47102.1 hypothetical protein BP01DRAFT_380945 [Aspergillus saccharolyticus JOP 1030-1]
MTLELTPLYVGRSTSSTVNPPSRRPDRFTPSSHLRPHPPLQGRKDQQFTTLQDILSPSEASIITQDNSSRSPTVRNNHFHVVKKFLEAAANVNPRDSRSRRWNLVGGEGEKNAGMDK